MANISTPARFPQMGNRGRNSLDSPPPLLGNRGSDRAIALETVSAISESSWLALAIAHRDF